MLVKPSSNFCSLILLLIRFSGVQEGRESDEHRDYEGGRFLKDLGDGGGLHQEDV
jgi:hypothetical protein